MSNGGGGYTAMADKAGILSIQEREKIAAEIYGIETTLGRQKKRVDNIETDKNFWMQNK